MLPHHFSPKLFAFITGLSLFLLLALIAPSNSQALYLTLDYSDLEVGGSIGTYEFGHNYARCDANLAPNVETRIRFGGTSPAAGSCFTHCMVGSPCLSRAFLQWDISSIPDTAIITYVGLKAEVFSPFTIDHYTHIKRMSVNSNDWPHKDEEFFRHIGTEPMIYKTDTNMFYSSGIKIKHLGTQAIQDLQNALDQDWFGLYFTSPAGEMLKDGAAFYYTTQLDDDIKPSKLSKASKFKKLKLDRLINAPGDGSDVTLIVHYFNSTAKEIRARKKPD